MTQAQTHAMQMHVAQTPYAEGNHWRATRGDEIIHLIGTLHLGDPRFDAIVTRLEPVLQRADRLLLEMTEAEQTELTNAMGTRPELFVLTDTSLPEILPDHEWQALAEALNARGIPAAMGAKMRPWYLSMMLSIPPCMMGLLAQQDGLDAQLEASAAALDLPTQALEPYDAGFRAFDAIPMDQQLAMIRSALTDDGPLEDMIETMLITYFEQAHIEGWFVTQELLHEYTSMSKDEVAQINDLISAGLLTRRNHDWIPVILAASQQTKGPIVVAFGAAHLGGKDGVLNLLADQGFTLSRQPF
jgi:uncharacterized protein YbaP (TraB family)